MNILKKNYKKIIVSLLVVVMTMSGMGQGIDVLAAEIHKVRIGSSYGPNYGKDIVTNTNLNQGITNNSGNVTLKREISKDTEISNFNAEEEVVEKRTENSKTFKQADGTYVQELYFEPVHKEENGVYEELDNDLENTSTNRSLEVFENKDGLYDFSASGNTATISTDGYHLSFINNEANMELYEVQDNVIYYSGAYENIDLEYRLRGNSVYTNYIINGPISEDVIKYTIDKGNLSVENTSDALVFKDGTKEVFSYLVPYATDADGNMTRYNLELTEEDNLVHISLSTDKAWVNDSQRIYPVKISTRAQDEQKKVDIDSSYIREKQPWVTSHYDQLFVGYEDGYYTPPGYDLGITRTYIRARQLSLGTDKEIIGAKLNLFKEISDNLQWNTIEINKTAGPVDPTVTN